jgi:hypothetical protein
MTAGQSCEANSQAHGYWSSPATSMAQSCRLRTFVIHSHLLHHARPPADLPSYCDGCGQNRRCCVIYNDRKQVLKLSLHNLATCLTFEIYSTKSHLGRARRRKQIHRFITNSRWCNIPSISRGLALLRSSCIIPCRKLSMWPCSVISTIFSYTGLNLVACFKDSVLHFMLMSVPQSM